MADPLSEQRFIAGDHPVARGVVDRMSRFQMKRQTRAWKSGLRRGGVQSRRLAGMNIGSKLACQAVENHRRAQACLAVCVKTQQQLNRDSAQAEHAARRKS